MLICLAHNLPYYTLKLEINCILNFIFAGIIGCGYFQSCRNFNPEVCDMVEKLVTTGRILWQWTKV